jgi:hypothetical protein
MRNMDSSVGIATAYRLEGRGVGIRIQLGESYFSSILRSKHSRGPPSFLTSVHLCPSSPGVKRQGREADHSPPTSSEVKKTGIHTSTPHTSSWPSVRLAKHWENFAV